MFYLIETLEQLKQFEQEEHFDDCYVEFIQGNDKKHPALDKPILIYIFSYLLDEGFMINLDHPECISGDIQWEKKVYNTIEKYSKLWVLDKKKSLHLYPSHCMVDLKSRHYLIKGKSFEDDFTTPAHTYFQRKFGQTNVNKMIPVGKHYDVCERRRRASLTWIYDLGMKAGTESLRWYDKCLIPVLYKLEQQGLQINGKFDEYFDVEKKFNVEHNKILGQYNFETTTGRPTNNFNGVNFSALKKDNGERECFEASNDFFVELDYEGYHPRIIAGLIGYEFGNESIHKQLAQMYFETDDITDELYKKSKEFTFQQMYGGINKKYLKHDYFRLTQNFIDDLWEKFNREGFIEKEYVETPIAKKRILKEHFPDITPQKLFNYYIQSIETENNIRTMNEIFGFLKSKKTKLVLYVYDSFLFDFSKEDGKETLIKLNEIIANGKFPLKIKTAKNYNELEVL